MNKTRRISRTPWDLSRNPLGMHIPGWKPLNYLEVHPVEHFFQSKKRHNVFLAKIFALLSSFQMSLDISSDNISSNNSRSVIVKLFNRIFGSVRLILNYYWTFIPQVIFFIKLHCYNKRFGTFGTRGICKPNCFKYNPINLIFSAK